MTVTVREAVDIAGPPGAALYDAGWRPERDTRLATVRTMATWLKARRDEHTPGNYPYWMLDCLLLELREAIQEGYVPGTELERMAQERQ